MQPMPGGLVIAFEGIDGAGKTTQLELVRGELQAADRPVLVLRNLGGTPIGEALREVMLSPLKRPPLTDFFVSLAIQEPLLEVIDNARAEGKIILLDRSPLSLAAYQIYGTGIDESIGWQHVQSGMDRIKPDAVILYNTDVETALSRAQEATGRSDYFESKSPEYFNKVAEGYRIVAERYPAIKAIDASQHISEIHSQTMALISPLLTGKP